MTPEAFYSVIRQSDKVLLNEPHLLTVRRPQIVIRNMALHALKCGRVVCHMESYIVHVELNQQEIRPLKEPALMKEKGVTDLIS